MHRRRRVRLGRVRPAARARLGRVRAAVRRHPRRPLGQAQPPDHARRRASSAAPTTRPPAAPTASSRSPAWSARSRSSGFQSLAFNDPVATLSGPFASSTALAAAGALAVVAWACGRLVNPQLRPWLDTLALAAIAQFTGLALEGAALAAALAAQALGLASLARRADDRYAAWAAVGFTALSLAHTLGTLADARRADQRPRPPARRRRRAGRRGRRAGRAQPRAAGHPARPPLPRGRRRGHAALSRQRRGRHARRTGAHRARPC